MILTENQVILQSTDADVLQVVQAYQAVAEPSGPPDVVRGVAVLLAKIAAWLDGNVTFEHGQSLLILRVTDPFAVTPMRRLAAIEQNRTGRVHTELMAMAERAEKTGKQPATWEYQPVQPPPVQSEGERPAGDAPAQPPPEPTPPETRTPPPGNGDLP